jgi:hypothetical protein
VGSDENDALIRSPRASGLREAGGLWRDVDDLVAAQLDNVVGLVRHGLGPLAADLIERRGETPPTLLFEQQRFARLAAMTAPAVLRRARDACEGPMMLMKGPEVAARYPGRARVFADLDLLVPDADETHRSLIAAGFVEEDDPEGLFVGIHHLSPLRWSGMLLTIEVHREPKWPNDLRRPDIEELVERGVPSSVEVPGVLAPDPAAHALLLAAHSWAHQPLASMRDLLDVGVVAAEATRTEIRALAHDWGMLRIFETMTRALEAQLRGRRTVPLRTWAGHVSQMREQIVFEQHLERVLSPFWALPPWLAMRRSGRALATEFRPAFDETWREKMARTRKALRRSSVPVTTHDRLLGESATRGRRRNPLSAKDRRG